MHESNLHYSFRGPTSKCTAIGKFPITLDSCVINFNNPKAKIAGQEIHYNHAIDQVKLLQANCDNVVQKQLYRLTR